MISTKKKYNVIQGVTPTEWSITIEYLPYKMEYINQIYNVTTADAIVSGWWDGVESVSHELELGNNYPVKKVVIAPEIYANKVPTAGGLTIERTLIADAVVLNDLLAKAVSYYTVESISATTNATITVAGSTRGIKVGDELVVTGSATAIKTVNKPIYDGKYIVSSILGSVITTTRSTLGFEAFALTSNMYINRRPDEYGILRQYTGENRSVKQGRWELVFSSQVFSPNSAYTVFIYPHDE